jgi:vancomycin resistance protein YoaR
MAISVKRKKLIFFILSLLLTFNVGFTYDENSINGLNFRGKVITLKYLSNEYIVPLEELFIQSSEGLSAEISEELLMNKINEIAGKLNKSPADAFVIDENAFTIQKEADGVILAGALLFQIIKGYISSGSLVDNYIIDIPVIIEKPKITESMLRQNRTIEISSFSTPFSPKMVDRTVNLKISTDILNGTIINPGEIFSMDDKLGDRTAEKGYRYAPAFSGERW